MKFEEALKAMREGKKVKRAKWKNISSIWIDKNNGEICTDDKPYEKIMSFAEIMADDWEICKEIERKNVMNFEEARKALLEGKKVRCLDWVSEDYVYFDEKNMVVRGNNGHVQTYGIYNMCKDKEWEFYEEKSKLKDREWEFYEKNKTRYNGREGSFLDSVGIKIKWTKE